MARSESNGSPILNPLDAVITEQEAKTAATIFDQKCRSMGILSE
jgi:hypothetical protein